MSGRYKLIAVFLGCLILLISCKQQPELESIALDLELIYSTEIIDIVGFTTAFDDSSIVWFNFIDDDNLLVVIQGDDYALALIYSIAQQEMPAYRVIDGQLQGVINNATLAADSLCKEAGIDYNGQLFAFPGRREILRPSFQSVQLRGSSMVDSLSLYRNRYLLFHERESLEPQTIFDADIYSLAPYDYGFVNGNTAIVTYRYRSHFLEDSSFPVSLIELVGFYPFDYWTRITPNREINLAKFIEDFDLDAAVVESLYRQAFGARYAGYALIDTSSTLARPKVSFHQAAENMRLIAVNGGGVLLAAEQEDFNGQSAGLIYIDEQAQATEIAAVAESISGAVSNNGNILLQFASDGISQESGLQLYFYELKPHDQDAIAIYSEGSHDYIEQSMLSKTVELPFAVQTVTGLEFVGSDELLNAAVRLSDNNRTVAMLVEDEQSEYLMIIK